MTNIDLSTWLTIFDSFVIVWGLLAISLLLGWTYSEVIFKNRDR